MEFEDLGDATPQTSDLMIPTLQENGVLSTVFDGLGTAGMEEATYPRDILLLIIQVGELPWNGLLCLWAGSALAETGGESVTPNTARSRVAFMVGYDGPGLAYKDEWMGQQISFARHPLHHLPENKERPPHRHAPHQVQGKASRIRIENGVRKHRNTPNPGWQVWSKVTKKPLILGIETLRLASCVAVRVTWSRSTWPVMKSPGRSLGRL